MTNLRARRHSSPTPLAELLRTRFPDRFVRRRLDRQLDEIVDAVEVRRHSRVLRDHGRHRITSYYTAY